MKKIIQIAAILLSIQFATSCDGPMSSEEKQGPTVKSTTEDTQEIFLKWATLRGNISISGTGAGAPSAWFMIGEDAATVADKGKKVEIAGVGRNGGSVMANVTDLKPDTDYYYVLVTSVDDKIEKGEVKQFYAPDAKVLVVDDNTVNLYVAKNLLAIYGIQPTCVTSGE